MLEMTRLMNLRVAACLLAGISAFCGTKEETMNRPRTSAPQRFTGNENVLVIAPGALRGSVITVDGVEAGRLWRLSHLLSSGIDEHYRPSIPANIDPNVTATRIFIAPGSHVVTIASESFAPISRQIGAGDPRPTSIVIQDKELEPRTR